MQKEEFISRSRKPWSLRPRMKAESGSSVCDRLSESNRFCLIETKLRAISPRRFILKIDTTDFEKAELTLKKSDGSLTDEKTFVAERELSRKLLPEIEQLLDQNNIQLENLKRIEVIPGPGSFTGTRIGIAVANTLGFGLGIKINGKKIVEPIYDREPKITPPRKSSKLVD